MRLAARYVELAALGYGIGAVVGYLLWRRNLAHDVRE